MGHLHYLRHTQHMPSSTATFHQYLTNYINGFFLLPTKNNAWNWHTENNGMVTAKYTHNLYNQMQEPYVLSEFCLSTQLKKKQKISHLAPIIIGIINVHSTDKPCWCTLKILLDTGTSSTLIRKKFPTNLMKTKENPTVWMTKGGSFMTKTQMSHTILVTRVQ